MASEKQKRIWRERNHKYKERKKEYYSRPEIKKKLKNYYSNPKIKERYRKWHRENYRNSEKRKSYQKEYLQRPEVKERLKLYMREYNKKNKIKKQSRWKTYLIIKNRFNLPGDFFKCKECKKNEGIELHHEVYPIPRKEIIEAITNGEIYMLCKKCHGLTRKK